MKMYVFDEGRNAYWLGRRMSDNPYSHENDLSEFLMWIRGFNAG